MQCPKCHSEEDKVVETRIMNNGETIRRRRQCLSCNYRFTTHETIMPVNITTVIKRDKRREEFSPEKLREGIRMACWKRNISSEVLDSIVGEIITKLTQLPQDEISSLQIGEYVMEALRGLDEVAYVRYASVYRHFKDVDAFVHEVNQLARTEEEQQQESNACQPAASLDSSGSAKP